MLLRKTLSLLGIGSAKVDFILEKERYHHGEKLCGYVFLKGGAIKQHIKRIECDLVIIESETEQEKLIDSITIFTSTFIQAYEEKKLPFRFQIPENAPALTVTISYKLKTKLIFNKGIESKKQELIYVVA